MSQPAASVQPPPTANPPTIAMTGSGCSTTAAKATSNGSTGVERTMPCCSSFRSAPMSYPDEKARPAGPSQDHNPRRPITGDLGQDVAQVEPCGRRQGVALLGAIDGDRADRSARFDEEDVTHNGPDATALADVRPTR